MAKRKPGGSEGDAPPPSARAADFFGLNRATTATLVVVGGLGLAEHLWRGFLGPYFNQLTGRLDHAVWLMGGFSAALNLLEAFGYLVGGSLAWRWGPRVTFAVAAVPLALGFGLAAWSLGPWAVIGAALLITSWEPLSLAATFDVVGASLPKNRRTIAFAVQSIQKRLPQVIGPLTGGLLFAYGFGANLMVAFAVMVLATVTQWRLLGRMKPKAGEATSLKAALAGMNPELRRLLTAEIVLRWGDWLTRDMAALYVVAVLARAEAEWGLYLALASTVALVTYIPVGKWVDCTDNPRLFIGLTFFLFALFPLNLVVLPKIMPVGVALVIVFTLNGLREVGEPARKALITTSFDPSIRARAVGLYWGLRSLAFFPAPLVAAALWTQLGPDAAFLVAGGLGMTATALFHWRVRRPAARDRLG